MLKSQTPHRYRARVTPGIPLLLVALLLPLGGLKASADYVRVNESNKADSMDVHIYRLDNGLTVYLTDNKETPRFYAEISVRAGSKHDPSDSTGLAH